MIYVIITPVRDEELHLAKTIGSVVAQTIRPQQWIIVNDGSTDRTGSIAEEVARVYPWINVVHRPDRGFRKAGGGVVEAFYDGYRVLDHADWDYLVKLDADLSFDENYFESCLRRFQAKPKLGIGGGVICSLHNGRPVPEGEDDPKFHVRGATKIYRRQCWEAIGGLIAAPGWDALDQLKANMLGWQTGRFDDLKLLQYRPTGMADGTWKNWAKNGSANYITGYHPLFMLLKCLKRSFRRPVLVGAAGLFWGFCRGYFRREKQVADPELIRYVRRQQLNKLIFRPSLW